MADFLIPALFMGIGLAVYARAAWLRRRRAAVPALLHVTSLFALGAGTFLATLLIMCKP